MPRTGHTSVVLPEGPKEPLSGKDSVLAAMPLKAGNAGRLLCRAACCSLSFSQAGPQARTLLMVVRMDGVTPQSCNPGPLLCRSAFCSL